MKKSIYAHPGLRHILHRLAEQYPDLQSTEYLPSSMGQAAQYFSRNLTPATQSEVTLLLDGTDMLLETFSTALCKVPNVHNAAALLLNPVDYLRVMRQYDGAVAFCFPGEERVRYFNHPRDCHILCQITDLDLGIPETAVEARRIAQELDLDYCALPCDYRILLDFLQNA